MGIVNITPFGKELRKLRIDTDEVLVNMADKLHITSAYLSAIENGKRRVPKDFIEKLDKIYSLSEAQIKSLETALVDTQNRLVISFPEECKDNDGFIETALLISKKFHKLDKRQLKEVKKILMQVPDDPD